MAVMDNLQMFRHYKDCPVPQTFVINYVLCLNCLIPYLHHHALECSRTAKNWQL